MESNWKEPTTLERRPLTYGSDVTTRKKDSTIRQSGAEIIIASQAHIESSHCHINPIFLTIYYIYVQSCRVMRALSVADGRGCYELLLTGWLPTTFKAACPFSLYHIDSSILLSMLSLIVCCTIFLLQSK